MSQRPASGSEPLLQLQMMSEECPGRHQTYRVCVHRAAVAAKRVSPCKICDGCGQRSTSGSAEVVFFVTAAFQLFSICHYVTSCGRWSLCFCCLRCCFASFVAAAVSANVAGRSPHAARNLRMYLSLCQQAGYMFPLSCRACEAF